MSDVIKAQYLILNDLKRIDEQIVRLERGLEQIPEDLAKLESKVKDHRDVFQGAKAQFESCEKRLRTAESELRDREDRLKKAESKMMDVKTNEEYQAAVKENEGQKAEKGKIEDQVLELLNEVEAQRGLLQDAEKEFKDLEATVTQEKQKLEAEGATLRKEYEHGLTQRNQLVARLDPSTSAMYHRALATIKGVPVTDATDGMCRSCNMQIRPQMYNEVLGFKAVHRCPSCGRILLVQPLREKTGPTEVSHG